LLQIRDFKSDDKAVYVPDEGNLKKCIETDIMIGRYGASVGQIHRGKAGAYNVALIRTTPDPDRLLPDFFYHYLTSDLFQEPLMARSSRGAQNGFNRADIAPFPVPLPPLEEQQRIVAVLDEALEGLARAFTHAEANLKNARELFPSSIAEIFSNSDGWKTCSVGDIGEVFDGPHATPKTVDQGPLFLGISSLVDGRIELEKTRHVTEEDFAKWTRRVEPRAGDVVFSYETRLGQVGLIPEDMRCCLGRRMGLVRLDEGKISPEFFVAYYLSPYFQEFLRENTVKGATVDRISIKEFPNFPVLLPQPDIQAAVVDQIAKLRDVHDRLVEQAITKLQDLDDLRQSLLQRAFAGELT
jgi:type I restriction enzyme S subunit